MTRHLDEPGERGWYVRATDPYGAVDYSPVSRFTVVEAAVDPEPEDPARAHPARDSPVRASREPGAPAGRAIPRRDPRPA